MREALCGDHPEDALSDKLRALLEYALRVTADPASCREAHVDALRAAGASDEEIHATVQVAAYFNYINRIADGLGVDLDPDMEAAERS